MFRFLREELSRHLKPDRKKLWPEPSQTQLSVGAPHLQKRVSQTFLFPRMAVRRARIRQSSRSRLSAILPAAQDWKRTNPQAAPTLFRISSRADSGQSSFAYQYSVSCPLNSTGQNGPFITNCFTGCGE